MAGAKGKAKATELSGCSWSYVCTTTMIYRMLFTLVGPLSVPERTSSHLGKVMWRIASYQTMAVLELSGFTIIAVFLLNHDIRIIMPRERNHSTMQCKAYVTRLTGDE